MCVCVCARGPKELNVSDEADKGEGVGEGSDGSTYGCVSMRGVKELGTDAPNGVVVKACNSCERDLTSGRVVKGWMHGIENGCEYDVGRKGNSDGGRDAPFMGSSRICVIIVNGGRF